MVHRGAVAGGASRRMPLAAMFLLGCSTVFAAPASGQPELSSRLFVQVGTVVHIRPSAFPESVSPRSRVGSPHVPGPYVAGGGWLSRRSTLRVEYERPGSQEVVSLTDSPPGVRPSGVSSRTTVLAFMLAFHPDTPRRPRLGFLMGIGANRTVSLGYDWYTGRTTSGRTTHAPALVLGAEACWPLGRVLDLVGSARLNLPFGSNHVLFRFGAGARVSFWRPHRANRLAAH